MRRFRQWLAETEDHMTESPDGKWALCTEALADIEAAVKAREKEFEVELSNLALAHEAAVKEATKSNRGCIGYTLDLEKQIAILEAAVKFSQEEKEHEYMTILEAQREEHRKQIAYLNRVLESKEKALDHNESTIIQMGDQITTLKGELIEKQKYILELEAAVHEWEDKCQKLTEQITALNDALSGRDGIIERLKGYLANKKTDIAEKVEYIAALTAENKRLEEEMVKLKEKLISRREWRFVDATPNGDLPRRILSAYIEDVFTTDNTMGILPENPLCKLMNETQEKRNIILRKAIAALKQGKEAEDEEEKDKSKREMA